MRCYNYAGHEIPSAAFMIKDFEQVIPGCVTHEECGGLGHELVRIALGVNEQMPGAVERGKVDEVVSVHLRMVGGHRDMICLYYI